MDHLAAKRFAKTLAEQGQAAATAKAIQLVTSSGGPASSGTKAANVKLHDDKSTYTVCDAMLLHIHNSFVHLFTAMLLIMIIDNQR
jgi:hypothetical protein